ncbi:MAG: sodium:solute symporter family transporter [Verrucomicrobiales bacterium]
MIHDNFTIVDWSIVFGYLLLTTWVGHAMRGKQGTIKDFFLGGRSLPWPAVSGSIIATEISGVTFIGVPGTLFALHGDFTYLQWAAGSIIARIIVAAFFVKIYFQREIYSPYDYMGIRLGNGVKVLATIFFTIGSILGQSVRVLVAAIPLKVVTGMNIEWCIIIIGIFAIGWTLMGGMRTVIWTDVMQFLLFVIGGVIALFWLINGISGGWTGMIETAKEFGRTRIVDPRFGIGPELKFTLWVALFAVPFQNLGIFGVDQLMAQRMFCCKSAKDAGKAIIFSSIGQLVTVLMLLIGAALFVNYHQNGFTDQEISTIFDVSGEKIQEVREEAQYAEHPVTEKSSQVPVPGSYEGKGKSGYIFPVWIVNALPVGLSGLILAGIFAAAISSLDSILAALSQTTLSLIYSPEKNQTTLSAKQLMNRSRFLVVIWGIVLTGFTLLLSVAQNIPILPLAFGMTTYTVGPMLGIFVCSILGKGSFRGLMIGCLISFLAVLFVQTDIWNLLIKMDLLTAANFQKFPTFEIDIVGNSLRSKILFAWMWPLTFAITMACGLFFSNKRGSH